MALGDITSRKAVLSAISEFEDLKREAFLAKYGFGPARSYFLVHDGKSYDSKAIIGAAHGFEFGKPLASSEFSGGDQTVAKKLEALGFEVTRIDAAEGELPEVEAQKEETGRHPTWNRDELIIALDAYVRWDGNPPGKNSDEIAAMSRAFNQLHSLLGTPAHKTLRNPNGVYMKLMNFRRFDPKYASQGKTGLSRGGRLEEEIWNSFHGEPAKLKKTAEAILATLVGAAATADDEIENVGVGLDDDEVVEALEGRVLSSLHFRRERSPKLAKAKKAKTLKEHGRLVCEVCRFDFLATYGERGRGFIECHHTKPLETLPGSSITRLEDLALLCANCHRMIHGRRPWLTVAELIETWVFVKAGGNRIP